MVYRRIDGDLRNKDADLDGLQAIRHRALQFWTLQLQTSVGHPSNRATSIRTIPPQFLYISGNPVSGKTVGDWSPLVTVVNWGALLMP